MLLCLVKLIMELDGVKCPMGYVVNSLYLVSDLHVQETRDVISKFCASFSLYQHLHLNKRVCMYQMDRNSIYLLNLNTTRVCMYVLPPPMAANPIRRPGRQLPGVAHPYGPAH